MISTAKITQFIHQTNFVVSVFYEQISLLVLSFANHVEFFSN